MGIISISLAHKEESVIDEATGTRLAEISDVKLDDRSEKQIRLLVSFGSQSNLQIQLMVEL